MNAPVTAPPDLQTWHAKLELELQLRIHATRVTRCRHRGPLYVQKAFYPEGDDLAHVYLLHPPGGVVSGDHLDINITLAEQARGLVTTPGAARIYRARATQPLQQQTVNLVVAAGASLEWFPLETIVFDGACVELDTTIRLDSGAQFIGWEFTCFGLTASKETFKHGSFLQRYRLLCDGQPEIIERLEVSPSAFSEVLDGAACLRGEPVNGLFIAGPFADSNSNQAAQGYPAISEADFLTLRSFDISGNAELSQLGNFLIGRYLGTSAERGRRTFAAWWSHLRPLLLGRPASAPRIWLT